MSTNHDVGGSELCDWAREEFKKHGDDQGIDFYIIPVTNSTIIPSTFDVVVGLTWLRSPDHS